jgi:hypothetical protein
MAKIEVDEEQWNASQRTLATMRKIASDPKRARTLEALHKEVDPNVATPLSDAEKVASESVTELRKEVDDLRKATEERAKKDEEERAINATKVRWEAGRQGLRDRGYSSSAIEKLEEMMSAKGIIDHEDAAILWEKAHPEPPPAMPGGSGAWNFLETPVEDKDSDIKRLIETRGNSDVLTNKMAHDALNDFRQQVAQANGRRR